MKDICFDVVIEDNNMKIIIEPYETYDFMKDIKSIKDVLNNIETILKEWNVEGE